MIQIIDLHKSYASLEVLKGINLSIGEQGIIAVLGPNGSGKTTLIKSILGMVIPQQGELLFDGKSISNQWQYRDKISYLPQIAHFPQNLRVSELIGMIKNLRPQETRESRLIDLFGLNFFLNKKLATLSGGTKQKVNIVLTFMFDSPMIILDEPTVGLDPLALIALKNIIREEQEKGRLILFTTHIMNLVEEIADRVIFLLDGNIYFNGTVNELKQQAKQSGFEQAIAEILKKSYV